MFDWLTSLFSTDGFVPRRECGAWTPEWVAVHTASDVLTWLAYLSIPLVLLTIARHPAVRPLRPLLWLFAAFIVSCGTVHLLEAVMFDRPLYRLSGVVKGVTAVVSWVTVFALVPAVRRLRPMLDRIQPPAEPPRPPRPQRVLVYVLAVLMALLAVLVRLALDPLLGSLPAHGLSLMAVIFVAWYGGFSPGLVTLLLSGIVNVYLFVPERNSLLVSGLNHQVDVGVYLMSGLGILLLGELQRVTRRRQQTQMAQLAAATSALATEKAAADRALAQLDALVRNAPYSIAFLDPDLRPVRVNDSFARTTRAAVEDHFGRRLPELFPDIPSDLLARYQQVLGGGPPVVGRLVSGDGRVWEVSAFQVPIADDDVGLGVIGQDVTEREAAAERVRESEERLRAMADGIPQLAWMTRPDGHIFWYNRRWYEYTGTTLEQMEGWGWQSVHDPAELPRVVDKFKAHLASGEPWEDTFPLRRHDGQMRWHLSRATPLKGDAGDVLLWFGTNTDVTEQRRLEEQLREGEARFRQLTEAMPQMVWMARPDGYHEYFNSRWYEFTGLTPTDSLGHGWSGPLHPDDVARSQARWKKSTDGGEPYEIEYRFRRHDGVYEWFLGRAVPVRDESGQVVRWLGTCTGIDEQVRTAQELHEARRFTESVLHSLPGHLAVIEADGRVLTVNESWRQFGEANGIPAGFDWSGANYFEACRGDGHGPRAEAGIRAVATGERGAFEMEYPCHGGGQERWFVLRANRFRGDGPVRLVITHENVTDRVTAERRVREQASELRQLTEGLPVLMWACRPTGECDYLSRQWLEYTGRPLDDQLGFGWLDALHADDRPPTELAWRAAVERGGGYDVEFRIRRHDGPHRWFAVRGFPVKDQRGEVVRWYGSCTDIDDRVRQEIVLEQIVEDRTAALTRSNEELEKFAYIASHDLQEPLRKIQAFGSRLADRFRPGLGDQGKDYIDRMLDSAGRMRRLIEDLLAFSRVNTKGGAFAPVDLGRLVREVLDDLEDLLVRTGGTVRTDPLPTVVGDTSQLRQVFQNLIGNALKFARPGVPPEVRLTAVPFDQLPDADRPPGRGWRMAVADNGIGFDPQYADRIFELFQRLHGRGEYEGTGLGLAIVRKIVLRHGATIAAHGRPGEGAEFVIDWPTPDPTP
jgi:PAS domain S-box-containing protein